MLGIGRGYHIPNCLHNISTKANKTQLYPEMKLVKHMNAYYWMATSEQELFSSTMSNCIQMVPLQH